MVWTSLLKLRISVKWLLTIAVILHQFINVSYSQLDLKLSYEQFDSEILTFASVKNSSNRDLSVFTTQYAVHQDLSGRSISKQVTDTFKIPAMASKRIYLMSLEYSVLSQSDIYFAAQSGDLSIVDSLNFDFPNKFRNVKNRDVDIDLGGVKVDRTRTPIGRTLFEKFEKKWASPEGISDYTLIFEELPFRFRTTILRVYLDSELIFETYLNDKEEFLDRVLAYTIGIIKSKLLAASTRSDELGGDWNGI